MTGDSDGTGVSKLIYVALLLFGMVAGFGGYHFLYANEAVAEQEAVGPTVRRTCTFDAIQLSYLPTDICPRAEGQANFVTLSDWGEFYLNASDLYPVLWYNVLSVNRAHLDPTVSVEDLGVMAIEFENNCWPLSDVLPGELSQTGKVVIVGPDDPAIELVVQPEARQFVKDLFTIGSYPVAAIELDFTFRVIFQELNDGSGLEAYTNEIYNKVLEHDLCLIAEPNQEGDSA